MADHQSVEQSVEDFFARYAGALLARDARAIAERYAVPGLILFPGQSLPVSSREQTEQFFAAAFGQYEGVTGTRAEVHLVAQTDHSAWADVTWRHEGGPDERMMYQLVRDGGGEWTIAVLTPLTVGEAG